ncbi:hypothetical protein EVAR_84400_1 [Eumeta japonica]|uniref:Uncharacterized protein n=1 Tax=Eumeta variegata TaxID=151549 RepID=A0A4C1YE88_EUMVA|nr:hypothetical protein EVAR_84400_1 [Eumeta japonica]
MYTYAFALFNVYKNGYHAEYRTGNMANVSLCKIDVCAVDFKSGCTVDETTSQFLHSFSIRPCGTDLGYVLLSRHAIRQSGAVVDWRTEVAPRLRKLPSSQTVPISIVTERE